MPASMVDRCSSESVRGHAGWRLACCGALRTYTSPSQTSTRCRNQLMGQKVNPVGFRTGVVRTWKSRWYASKQDFSNLLIEDFKIRNFVKNHPKRPQYRSAGIDRIEIERTRDEVKVTLHVARPGLIIGKK